MNNGNQRPKPCAAHQAGREPGDAPEISDRSSGTNGTPLVADLHARNHPIVRDRVSERLADQRKDVQAPSATGGSARNRQRQESDVTKKYEFTGETKNHFGITLRQIRALVTIAGIVTSGEVGGWIESEKCLDQSGNAWVSGNARVYGNARVSGNARVYGNALVFGNARVYGNARVSGDARVSSLEAICTFSGFGSQYRTTTAFLDKELGIRIVCGCFTGTLYQFREQIIKTHREDSKHGKLYLGMANMIEFRLDVPESFSAVPQ